MRTGGRRRPGLRLREALHPSLLPARQLCDVDRLRQPLADDFYHSPPKRSRCLTNAPWRTRPWFFFSTRLTRNLLVPWYSTRRGPSRGAAAPPPRVRRASVAPDPEPATPEPFFRLLRIRECRSRTPIPGSVHYLKPPFSYACGPEHCPTTAEWQVGLWRSTSVGMGRPGSLKHLRLPLSIIIRPTWSARSKA